MLRRDCGCLVLLLIGAILGSIVGYFVYTTAIAGIVAALWIGFGIGIGALLLLTIIALFAYSKKERCVCNNGTCIAIAAIGTIITTIIGLSITITTGVLLIAALIGLATLFLSITLFAILRLILCLIYANCSCKE